MAHDVPKALGVEQELGAAVERDVGLGVGLGEAVLVLLHQDHEAVGIVGQLQPRPHDPTLVRRVEPVVVVAVHLAPGGVVVLRLELDHPHASEVGAHGLDVVLDLGATLGVDRELAVLVGPLVARLPEAAAVQLAVGGGDRREVGVAAALPVHVLERQVLGLGDRLLEVPQVDEAAFVERVEPRVRGVERDVGRPVGSLQPMRHDVRF